MRPGDLGRDPFATLARALLEGADDLPDYEHGRPAALPELRETFPCPDDLARLLAEPRADVAVQPLIRVLDTAARAKQAGGGYEREVNATLLLVVDQLEELFGFAEDVRARHRPSGARRQGRGEQ
jgi:hypothetical protein